MLVIYCDAKEFDQASEIVTLDEGLKNFASVKPREELGTTNQDLYLIIEEYQIKWPLEWHNLEPPVLIKPQPFNKINLLALIFAKTGHHEVALQYAENPSVSAFIKQLTYMYDGNGVFPMSPSLDYYEKHNVAILQHYSGNRINGDSLNKTYEEAIDLAPDNELRAFTARHYAIYLNDLDHQQIAQDLLNHHLSDGISTEGTYAMKSDLVSILMGKLSFPYPLQAVQDIKTLIGDCLKYYESNSMDIQVAMLLVYASEMANINDSYSESLSYINRAIAIYESEQIPEFIAHAFLRKGTLLYTWAQSGNPQFFKTAIETYQQALKVFKKESFPSTFAEIHHNLGVIYAEAPVDENQRSIRAAISASSFKESLEFYTMEEYPYEFAMVCNNYANALINYPSAKNTDNFEKAIHYYNQALAVRTAERYPLERAHSLLNYLEACWRVNNINSSMERVRYKDMVQKAEEVKDLIDDESLLTQADEHLEKLKALQKVLILS